MCPKRFRDATGRYRPGPADVITKALAAGLRFSEYKAKVVCILDMKGGGKNEPNHVLDVMREAAVDWKTVEEDDHCCSKNLSKAG